MKPVKPHMGPEPHSWQVRHLKLDAQGADLSLIQATSAEVLRAKVQAITMEVVFDDCEPLYEGQPQCTQVLGYMLGIGYEVDSASVSMSTQAIKRISCRRDPAQRCPGQKSCCEQDVKFVRTERTSRSPPAVGE